MVNRPLFGLVASLLFSLAAGGCFALGWDYHEAPNSCSKDADCADDNPCHVATCGADATCSITNATQDPPDDHPGDCKRIHCTQGVAETIIDDKDVDDDGNSCTIDACDNGKPVHTPIVHGGACTNAGHHGVCNKGNCVIPCQGGADCTATDPCTIGACNLSNNQCYFMKLDGVAPPGVPPVVGDCLDATCVDGVTKQFGDPDDLPIVPQCYKGQCVDSGDPSRPLKAGKSPKASRAACSSGGSLCDGNGDCVECIDDGDCPPDGNLCHTPTCSSSGHCTYPNTSAGPSSTLTSMQVSGDCHQLQCDGNGGVIDAVDPTDPHNLGNPCLNYFCDGSGNNQTSNKNNGSNCGNGLSCSNGVCSGCTMTSQCPSHPLEACDAPNCDCPGAGLQLKTCSSQGVTCGAINDTGCGASLNCNDGKDGQETDVDCGGPVASCPTRCALGQACNLNSDCANGRCVDGFCCESSCTGGCVACSAALNGVGNGLCRPVESATDPGTCDATHGGCAGGPPCKCSAGACIKCSADSDCGVCQRCTAGACANVTTATQTAGRCDDTHGNCVMTCTSEGVPDCGTRCACDGNGACLLRPGEACTCDANCASGSCNNSHISCTDPAGPNVCN